MKRGRPVHPSSCFPSSVMWRFQWKGKWKGGRALHCRCPQNVRRSSASHLQLPGPLLMSLCLRPQQVRTEPVLLPLSRVPSAAQKVGPGLLLSPHLTYCPPLFYFGSFLSPIRSKTLYLSRPTISLAAPIQAWDQERGSKRCSVQPDAGTGPTGLKMADRAVCAACCSASPDSSITLQAVPYHASALSVRWITIIERLLNALLCLSSSLPLKLLLAKNK